jgi:putative inorganic carbon (HCO3(-)) transporter
MPSLLRYSLQAIFLLGFLILSLAVLLPGQILALTIHAYLIASIMGCSIICFFLSVRRVCVGAHAAAALHNGQSRRIVILPSFVPILGISTWLSVNVWSSAEPITSWIATGYLVLGIALYMLTISLVASARQLAYLPLSLTLIGTSFALVLPLMVEWKPQFRLFYLPLYSWLQAVQWNIGETVHPNVFAGALVLTVPVTLSSFAWFGKRQRWQLLRWLLLVSATLQLSMLLLSQSRGGYLAIATAITLTMLLYWPRLTYLLPLGIIGFALAIRYIGWITILNQFSSDSALGGWSGRLEIWQTSLLAISDFPFTGIGIGTFTTIIPLLYPLTFPIESYPHAHNLFLQVALDLGLPGLIAYLALLINLGAMLIVTLRRAPRHTLIHSLAIGAAGSLVGMLVHGLLDAVLWGTKLAFLPWLLFALITQLFLQAVSAPSGSEKLDNKPA